MFRYVLSCNKVGENDAIDAFLGDLAEVCKKHQMSLSHEDTHGSFQVCEYDEGISEWMMDADDAFSTELE